MSITFNDQLIAEKFLTLCEDVSAIKTNVNNMQVDIDEIKKIKKTVDKHDRAYSIGKVLGVPALAVFHVSLKHFLTKIGF